MKYWHGHPNRHRWNYYLSARVYGKLLHLLFNIFDQILCSLKNLFGYLKWACEQFKILTIYTKVWQGSFVEKIAYVQFPSLHSLVTRVLWGQQSHSNNFHNIFTCHLNSHQRKWFTFTRPLNWKDKCCIKVKNWVLNMSMFILTSSENRLCGRILL